MNFNLGKTGKTLIFMSMGLLPWTAEAYIGPGTGLSAIGAFLAVIFGLIVALFGFVWYPVKRVLRKLRQKKQNRGGEKP